MNLHLSYFFKLIIFFLLFAFIFYTIQKKTFIEGFINFTYEDEKSSIKNKKSTSNIAIITSIYGNYDNFKNQSNVLNADKVDWYVFTDNSRIDAADEKWNIITTPYHIKNTNIPENKLYKNYYENVKDEKTKNMMSAKYYKIQAHDIDILQKYDYFIWIDGSIFLRNDFINNILEFQKKNYELVNFKHSKRDNVHDEYSLSIKMDKYKNQELDKQYEFYINDKFPDNVGLYECTVCMRKNNQKINNVFDLWWVQNIKWSYQDQISYPYVLWKSGVLPDYVINDNVFNNSKYTYVEYNLMKKH